MSLTPIIESEEALWLACSQACSDVETVRRLLRKDEVCADFLLAYAPVARRNRFQSLLYSEAYGSGFRLLPLSDYSLLSAVPWPGTLVCHLHWLSGLTRQLDSFEKAESAVAEWAALLALLRNKGARIVWTIHNVLPHESKWPDQDQKIRQLTAEAADVLHVMTSETSRLCSEFFELPSEKVMLVPHPAYVGAQPSWISRAEARALLGISRDEFVYLSFGAVLPYKGYDRLMQAYDAVSSEAPNPTRLLISGQASDSALAGKLRVWAAGRTDIRLDLRPIPDDEIQLLFSAADVAVCPYERTLNSGAALMALSFDLPVVGPSRGAFVDNIGDNCAFLYAEESVDALSAAMKRAATSALASYRAACSRRKQELAPARISKLFFEGLRTRLESR